MEQEEICAPAQPSRDPERATQEQQLFPFLWNPPSGCASPIRASAKGDSLARGSKSVAELGNSARAVHASKLSLAVFLHLF